MNIFILSEQIKSADHYRQQAEFHIDRHVVKMIAESTQMLVTALATKQFPELLYLPDSLINTLPCKPLSASMRKHPCTVWTSANITNLNYLACLAQALCIEHQYRYPLSPEHIYASWLNELVAYLSSKGYGQSHKLPTHFAVAVKDINLRSTNTSHIDALDIYRRYYYNDKVAFATWKKRQKPVWWLMMEDNM